MGSRRTAFGASAPSTVESGRWITAINKIALNLPPKPTTPPHIQAHNNLAHNDITRGDAARSNPSHGDSAAPNNAPVKTPISDTAVTDELITKQENHHHG